MDPDRRDYYERVIARLSARAVHAEARLAELEQHAHEQLAHMAQRAAAVEAELDRLLEASGRQARTSPRLLH